MGAIRFLKLLSSLALLLLMIKYLGANTFSDSWFLAVYIYSAINMFFWGPFNELFRGKFLNAKLSSEEIIELLTTINYINLAFSFFFIIIIFLTQNTNDPENYLVMLGLLLPLLTAQQITASVTAILNCNKKYILPEILVVFAQIMSIAIFILVFPYFQL
jgi:peptidoglycan biosynthesis protein MviN/MurJ (putative lipid II flippase)